MSDTKTDQNQSVPAKDTEQQATATSTSAADASKTENGSTSSGTQEPLQQTGPGPKQLLSHFRGMPNQWEKNRAPKKDGE
ncbi:hypothetical protein F4808DRAFT_459104 [Astrocystis sublimbata]|nr:hypothetical protein F4808DRAFT_466163 [Astrocystis sublimbata]KAI0202093.1 hypothetical protein F4808DRAFT_459104 [Astrocystis sublimbata]